MSTSVGKTRPVVVVAILAGLVIALAYLVESRGDSGAVHVYDGTAHDLPFLWQRLVAPIATGFPSADNERVYLSTAEPQQLLALGALSGDESWGLDLRLGYTGIRQIIADGTSVYALNATRLTAYEASTGRQEWSTRLGDGHVRAILEDAGDALLAYYGGDLIRVSKLSGAVVDRRLIGRLLWVTPVADVHEVDGGMIGIDPASGVVLWRTSSVPFMVSEDRKPQSAGSARLLVYVETERLCMLDVQTGLYAWCAERPFVSNAVVDPSQERVYVLDEDYTLLSLDIASGDSEIIASFPFSELVRDSASYHYALSASADRLFLYFGDTTQLFALAINPG
jgi:outer membrane protein assembly factor BamB